MEKVNKITRLTAVFALCVALLIASAGFRASSYNNGGCLGSVPATRTTIAVDGMKEAVYNDGLKVEIKYPKTEEQSVGATGTVYLLCTNGSLYVFFEVTDEGQVFDPIPANQQNKPWLTESCEVFIHEKNSNNEQDIVQYRVDWTGWPSLYTKTGIAKYGSAKVGSDFGYAASRSTTGYKVEFRIPLKSIGSNVLAGDNYDLGIHFQINDVKDEEANLNWATEYSAATGGGSDSWQADAHPYVILGSSSIVPGENPTEAPTEEPTPEPTEVPTEAPVETPEPTEEATEGPTEEPTEAPTDEPAVTEEPATTDEPASEEPADATPTPEVVEPADTDEPAADPTQEPAADPTQEPAEAPTDAPAEGTAEEPTAKPAGKKGCGNTIGGTAALILAAVTAFVALNPRKKD